MFQVSWLWSCIWCVAQGQVVYTYTKLHYTTGFKLKKLLMVNKKSIWFTTWVQSSLSASLSSNQSYKQESSTMRCGFKAYLWAFTVVFFFSIFKSSFLYFEILPFHLIVFLKDSIHLHFWHNRLSNDYNNKLLRKTKTNVTQFAVVNHH